MFDLQGFTNFCKQIEPQLSVPLYLSKFLDWIFAAIRDETCHEELPEGIWLWHSLPFFTKVMGDGLLMLWNTSTLSETNQHNIIISLYQICLAYKRKFLEVMKRQVCEPPGVLRCGIAKGTVYSVGAGDDFVGPCINLASRLQKLDGVTFAWSRRGFNPEGRWKEKQMSLWILKKVPIRGMDEGELIYLMKSEFDAMKGKDKRMYKDP